MKSSHLITMTIIAALLLSLGLGAFAVDTTAAAFTIRTIDGYNTPIGGASFSLLGSDGSSVASVSTGSTGYATINIPATAIADEGSSKFTLVQTSVPSGYETTDNNWEVTVNVSNGKTSVNISANGLWDTIFDWIEGSVLTGSEYAGGILTVANIVRYYEVPKCTKTVVGLNYAQIQGYTSDYKLTDFSGKDVATGHAIGFSAQEDHSFKAPIIFDKGKLPAGTYALIETSATPIKEMKFKGSKFMNNNGVLIVGENGSGEVVYAQYVVPSEHIPANENEKTSANKNSKHAASNNEEAKASGKTELYDKNEKDNEKTQDVEIDDEKVPKAAKAKSSNTRVWIIVAIASVIMVVALIRMTKKSKFNI